MKRIWREGAEFIGFCLEPALGALGEKEEGAYPMGTA